MKLSLPTFSIPRPTIWDWLAIAVAATALAVAGLSWRSADSNTAGGAMSSSTAVTFVLIQLGVSAASLIILGKTARAGTITGNLAAVIGTLLGISGGLLTAALWVAA